MAKHRQKTNNTRRVVAASAAVAGLAAVTPGVANAAEVVVPGTDVRVNVDGIENIPGIANVPGIENYVPSLAGQQAPNADIASAVAAVKANPVISSIPGLGEAIERAAGINNGGAPAAPTVGQIQSAGQAIVDAVRSKIGSPYGWGAAGPQAFDCSGLTSWAYAQIGKAIPRTSQGQAGAGQQVPLSSLQPGDIIVYYSGASHVGIYTGNGTIIDSLNSNTTVQERDLNYMPIHSAVRF